MNGAQIAAYTGAFFVVVLTLEWTIRYFRGLLEGFADG